MLTLKSYGVVCGYLQYIKNRVFWNNCVCFCPFKHHWCAVCSGLVCVCVCVCVCVGGGGGGGATEQQEAQPFKQQPTSLHRLGGETQICVSTFTARVIKNKEEKSSSSEIKQ